MSLGFNFQYLFNKVVNTAYADLYSINIDITAGKVTGYLRYYETKEQSISDPEMNLTRKDFIKNFTLDYSYGMQPDLTCFQQAKSFFPGAVDAID